jgi:anti-sigma factor (TIGR02949 family)
MNEPDDKSTIEDIGCLQAIEALYAYLDGELDDPASVEKFEHHMRHCRSCYTRTEIEQLLTTRVRESDRSRAPAVLRGRIRKLMDEFEDA